VTVGVARVALHFPASGSLKTKRSAVKSLLDGARARFNVAAAEVEHQELWQRSTLAFATVNTERSGAESTISKTVHYVEESYKATVLDVSVEMH